jgi:hypothetical protein
METEICGAILDFAGRRPPAFLEASALVAVLAEPVIVPFPSSTGTVECTLFEGVALTVYRVGIARTAIVIAPVGADPRSRVVLHGLTVRAVTRATSTGDGWVILEGETLENLPIHELLEAAASSLLRAIPAEAGNEGTQT